MSNEPKAGKGIDPEMLAAYIDNRLPPEQRAAVEAQLATDPESYALLVDTLEALDDDEIKVLEVKDPLKQPIPFAPKSPKSRFRSLVIASGALAAAAVIAVAIVQPQWLQRYLGSDVDPLMARLVEAVGDERYVEARLTGGFRHGALRPATRGTEGLSQQNLSLLAVAGEAQGRAKAIPSSENLHVLGVAQLQLRDPESAVRTLESAVEASQFAAPDLLSDLAAAYLDGAKRLSRPEWIPRALETSLKALEAAPTHTVALYNRALALEAIGAADSAVDAWQQLLATEVDPAWRAEIEQRINELRKPTRAERWQRLKGQLTAASIPSALPADDADLVPELRTFLVQEAIPNWMGDVARRPLRADDPIRSLASLITTASGDPFYARVVDEIAGVAISAPTYKTSTVAYLQLVEALKGIERAAFSAALPVVTKAAVSLDDYSALKLLAQLNVAVCEYYTANASGAQTRLNRVVVEAERHGFLEVAARAQWLLGLVAFTQGDLSNAETHYVSMSAGFKRTGDKSLEARSQGLLANLFGYVGERERAWTHRVQAMRGSRGDTRNVYAHLAAMAEQAGTQGLLRSALEFQSAAVVAASALGNQGVLAEGFGQQALFAWRVGSTEHAMDAMARAEEHLSAVTDPSLSQRYRAQVDGARAEIFAARDPGVAIESANRAIEELQGRSEHLRLARLYRWLSEAHTNGGNFPAALDAASSGTKALQFEVLKAGSKRGPSRLDAAYEVIDAGLLAAVKQGSDSGAFWWSLEGRRLSASLKFDQASVNQLEELQPLLQPGEVTYSLSQVGNRIFAQAIRRESVTSRLLEATIESVERSLNALVEKAPFAQEAPQEVEDLYRLLVLPVLGNFDGVTHLNVLPSGVMAKVPFSALRVPGAGFYLTEKATVVIRRRASASASGHQATPRSVLVAGFPAHRRDAASLPQALAEIASVARAYPSANSIAPTLSSAEFVKHAQAADVLHIATHAVVNEEHPELSRLLVGKDERFDVHAYDLLEADLSNVQVVFLSACRTAVGRLRRGEGTLSLASAFLDAGSHAAIATLWEVPDNSMEELASGFHRLLRAGYAPEVAIQKAQIEAIRRQQPFSRWASVSVMTDFRQSN